MKKKFVLIKEDIDKNRYLADILIMMEKSDCLARSYLETLSTAELIDVAEEYGIDIPDDLDRQFIIGDLLEVAQELEDSASQKESIVLSDEEEVINVDTLPQSYNETRVNVMLRNPVSLFVWWDLNENSLKSITDSNGELHLAVYFFENENDEKPCDTFGVQVSVEDRAHYVIIPAGKKFVRVDLVCEGGGKTDTIAISQKVKLPFASDIMALKPGEKLELSQAMLVSGTGELLRAHYNEYRQSFF